LGPYIHWEGGKPKQKTTNHEEPNKPLGEGTSGVKSALQVSSTKWIFIETIPIDIPIGEVIITSYSEEKMAPKTPKAKFVKSLASSTPSMVARQLQFMVAASSWGAPNGWGIFPPKSQSQSDLTSTVESQVYSGLITRSRATSLTYIKVTLQSSVTTFNQGKDQLEEQNEVASPAFYDLRNLFHEEESLTVIPQEQITEGDQAQNMLVLVTSTPILEEQM